MGYITKICPGLANHLTILRQIVVGNGAAGCRKCFAVTDTGNIIGVTDTGTILGAAGGLDLRHYCSQTYSLIVYAQARVVYFHSIVHFLSKKR